MCCPPLSRRGAYLFLWKSQSCASGIRQAFTEGPRFFHKAPLFSLSIFNMSRHGYRSLFHCRLESGLDAQAMAAIAESQLLVFGREGITTLLSGSGTSQAGVVGPQSHWKARRTAYPVQRIIGLVPFC